MVGFYKSLGLLSGYKTVDEINLSKPTGNGQLSTERRKQFKICVIDDQTFEPARNLRSFGYDIAEINDLKKIDEVAPFPVVLCDLMGVGMNFDSKRQGAMLIREIRTNFPSIMVAAYSGSSQSSEQAKEAQFYADTFIQKDADYDTWTRELDGMIRKASNPREVWYRIRHAIINDGVNTKDLLRLEDAYVESISQKDMEIVELKKAVNNSSLNDLARNIIVGVATKTVIGLIVGT